MGRKKPRQLSLQLWCKAASFRWMAHAETNQAIADYWHWMRGRYAYAAIKTAPYLYERFEKASECHRTTVRVRGSAGCGYLDHKEREMHLPAEWMPDVELRVVRPKPLKESQHEATQTPRT